MARSILGSFVSGTRQMLVAQLFISIGAVALSGWTLGVTNDLIRERNRLKERVIQLEETLAASDIMVPPTAEVVNPPRTEDAYPPSVALPEQPAPERAETSTTESTFDPRQLLGELFAPPPPMQNVVLHARSAADAGVAQRLAAELTQTMNLHVAVDVMQAGDARESGYAYFDGRQNRSAAALMQRFHDIARRNEVAAWSAQLRGVALPAQGEYTADRLDIVLPPLPAAPQRNFEMQPEPQQPTIR